MSDPRGAGAAGSNPVERWAMPQMDGPVVGRPRDERRSGPDAARLARQDAETRGYEAGLAKARTEMQEQLALLEARVQTLDSLLQLLARPLQNLDAQIESELTHLALAVGRQLVRRELRIDPAQVIAIIRESLAQLPVAARDVRVHLHPEDAATVREKLAAPVNERAWTIVEDPTLSRGGCLVRSEMSQIDARLESRVQAVITSTLGEERATERQSDTVDPTAEGRL
jgi:flagellar assembly protein FliH